MNDQATDPYRFQWGEIAVLGISASFLPLQVMARNPVGIVHPERLLMLAVGVWALSVILVLVLVRIALPRRPAVYTVFLVVVLFMTGRPILDALGEILGLAAVALVVVGLGVVFSRLGDSWLSLALVVGLAVALIAGPVGLLVAKVGGNGAGVVPPRGDLTVDLESTPDIFLIVLDGYPSLETIQRDTGLSNQEFVDELNGLGFDVPGSIWSSYWSTQLSISSLLYMGYPVVAPDFDGDATRGQLYQIVSGANPFVDLLAMNGYETYMIESGWSGASCGPAFDHCVPSAWFEESMAITLRGTLIAPFVSGPAGSPFTVGALHSMDWLEENAGPLSHATGPSFVFAHLLAPHPPFYLNDECEPEDDPGRASYFFDPGGGISPAREGFHLEQLECVNRFLVHLARSIQSEDVVIVVSDHGTDRRHQLSTPANEWDMAAISERLQVFAAIRMGNDCSVGDRLVVPNLLARVISCLSSDPVPDVPDRLWIKPMVEVERSLREVLMNTS